MNIKKQNNKPEEEVRRFIINYLIRNFKYDKSLFRIEQKISENTSERSFRPDVIVYDNKPFLTKPYVSKGLSWVLPLKKSSQPT